MYILIERNEGAINLFKSWALNYVCITSVLLRVTILHVPVFKESG